ncbi:MAG TPA: DUF1573 domain-containing protein [Pirellulales bacterium]
MSCVRLQCLGLLVMLALNGLAQGQDWARKMFETTSHDFGNVARGARVEYNFKFHNPYKEDAHIIDVRSSCGCTTPRVLNDTLKTYDETAVVAAFNTRSFLGQRSATLTVVFDKPYYAEVQLQVAGYIRRDIVIHPGEVDLGTVDQGTPVEKQISIAYAGRGDWQITDVKSQSPYVDAQIFETRRDSGQVTYDLKVQLRPDAPAGTISEQLVLLTNDQRSPEVPLDVEGRVVADLTVSPASVLMGVLEPGQKATKQLVIKAKKPFRITGIYCDDESFEIKAPNVAKPLHVVPITFLAGDKTGKIAQKIRVTTDLGEDVVAEFSAYAQVVSPERPLERTTSSPNAE